MAKNPCLRLKYKIVVKNKDGEVLKEYERDARSFVKNFLLALHSSLIHDTVSLVDVNGNAISNTGILGGCWSKWCNSAGSGGCGASYLQLNAPEGEDSYGIVVGVGTTPVSPDDYSLEQKIPHGSEDNKLYYQKTSVGSVSVVDGKLKVSISRVFRNDGSVDLDINEIGLQALVRDTGGGTYCVLIVRDVLPDTEVIPGNGGVLIVTYSISA